MNSGLKRSLGFLRLVLFSLATAALTGCGTPRYAVPDADASNTAPPTNSTPVSAPANTRTNLEPNDLSADLLSPGMKISVTFSGINPPPPRHEEQIREDGCINPPLLKGTTKAAGKTIGQLQQELQSRYVPAFFKNATVTVTRPESYYFVTGEVKNAGQKPYLSKMTITSAIATAGGFTEFAKRTKVEILRSNGHKETVNCDKAIRDPKYDVPIYPDDKIIVRQRWY